MKEKPTPAELRALVDSLTAHNLEQRDRREPKDKRNITERDEKRKA